MALTVSCLAGFVFVEGETPRGFALPVLVVILLGAGITWWFTRGQKTPTTISTAHSGGGRSPAQSAAHSGEGDINLSTDGGRREPEISDGGDD